MTVLRAKKPIGGEFCRGVPILQMRAGKVEVQEDRVVEPQRGRVLEPGFDSS